VRQVGYQHEMSPRFLREALYNTEKYDHLMLHTFQHALYNYPFRHLTPNKLNSYKTT